MCEISRRFLSTSQTLPSSLLCAGESSVRHSHIWTFIIFFPYLSLAMSTTEHFTKYTAIQCTDIQCTDICSALIADKCCIKWNTYVNHLAEGTDANLLATPAKLNLPKKKRI